MVRMHPVFAPHFKKPRGLFGLLAARYMLKRNGFVYQGIERFAEFSDGLSVLEIGYGPGYGLGYLLSKHAIAIDGIDFSPLMFRKATRANRSFIEAGRLRLRCGDILAEGKELGSYDRVVFANVLYFWDDLDAAFTAVKARLAPGGRLVFYMSNKSRLEKGALTSAPVFHHYDSKEVMGSLERSGFRDVEEHRIVDDSGDFLIVTAHE
jgi:SAM-dependent methyltransferase